MYGNTENYCSYCGTPVSGFTGVVFWCYIMCMHFRNSVIRVFIFFLCLQKLCAQDVQITDKELGFDIRGEYNRSLYFTGDIAVRGAIELNNRFAFTGGVALGVLDSDVEIKAFGSGRIALFSGVPLHFGLAYIYSGLPGDFNMHTHSILPIVSLNYPRAGIAIGTNLRFTGFYGESPIFESGLSFSGYVNFVAIEKLRIGLSLGNFSDFSAANMGAIFLKLYGVIPIAGQWSIISEIELFQSGIDGLTTTFYGIAFRGGVRFAW